MQRLLLLCYNCSYSYKVEVASIKERNRKKANKKYYHGVRDLTQKVKDTQVNSRLAGRTCHLFFDTVASSFSS